MFRRFIGGIPNRFPGFFSKSLPGALKKAHGRHTGGLRTHFLNCLSKTFLWRAFGLISTYFARDHRTYCFVEALPFAQNSSVQKFPWTLSQLPKPSRGTENCLETSMNQGNLKRHVSGDIWLYLRTSHPCTSFLFQRERENVPIVSPGARREHSESGPNQAKASHG